MSPDVIGVKLHMVFWISFTANLKRIILLYEFLSRRKRQTKNEIIP